MHSSWISQLIFIFCNGFVQVRKVIRKITVVLFFYLSRFKSQTQLHKSKPSEFKMAIEEADLAEAGYMDSFGYGRMACAEANASVSQEASGFTSDQVCG